MRDGIRMCVSRPTPCSVLTVEPDCQHDTSFRDQDTHMLALGLLSEDRAYADAER